MLRGATLGLSLRHMRDLKTEYMDAARLDIRLANSDHKYSPPNASSALHGKLKPGRKVWLSAAFPCDEFGGAAGASLANRAPEYGRGVSLDGDAAGLSHRCQWRRADKRRGRGQAHSDYGLRACPRLFWLRVHAGQRRGDARRADAALLRQQQLPVRPLHGGQGAVAKGGERQRLTACRSHAAMGCRRQSVRASRPSRRTHSRVRGAAASFVGAIHIQRHRHEARLVLRRRGKPPVAAIRRLGIAILRRPAQHRPAAGHW